MTSNSVSFEDLRVILCLEFDRRAEAARVEAFKATLSGSPSTVQSIEITGSFDFMLELAMKDMVTYTSWLANLADSLAAFVARYEVNFVSRRFVRQHRAADAIWVPSNGDMQRIDRSLIDKVTAEGDYVRIHSQGATWLGGCLHRNPAVDRRSTEIERLRPNSSVDDRSLLIRRPFNSPRQAVDRAAGGRKLRADRQESRRGGGTSRCGTIRRTTIKAHRTLSRSSKFCKRLPKIECCCWRYLALTSIPQSI